MKRSQPESLPAWTWRAKGWGWRQSLLWLLAVAPGLLGASLGRAFDSTECQAVLERGVKERAFPGCTAVVGSHTHVQTADEWVLPQGTAYISDVGMCGPMHSVIGVRTDRVLERFRTGMPRKFEVAKGPAIFCAALIDADEATGKAREIRRILIRDA